MEGQGMSTMFNGGGSIRLNESLSEKHMEEEQQQDAERLKLEIQNDLAEQMSDFVDDDSDHSVADETDIEHLNGLGNRSEQENLNHMHGHIDIATNMNHMVPRQYLPPSNTAYSSSPLGGGDGPNKYTHKGNMNGYNTELSLEHQRLMKSYEMLARENKELTDTKMKMERALNTDIESLRVRLKSCTVDKMKAESETQHYKQISESSEHKLMELKHKNNELERSREQIEEEYKMLEMKMKGVQMELAKLQKNDIKDKEKTDSMFRKLQEKHMEEHDVLSNQLKIEREKFKRLEETLIDKNNKLTDLLKQNEKIMKLEQDRVTANMQITKLGAELEKVAGELKETRDKLHECQKTNNLWRLELQRCLPPYDFSFDDVSPSKLGEVLSMYRANLEQMKQELDNRDAQLHSHKNLEIQLNRMLKDSEDRVKDKMKEIMLLNESKDELEAYKARVVALEQELKRIAADNKEWEQKYTNLELRQDNKVEIPNTEILNELRILNEKYIKDNKDMNECYLKACESRDKSNRELRNAQNKLNEFEPLRDKNKELIQQIDGKNSELEIVTSQVNLLKEELDGANKRIAELERDFLSKEEISTPINKYLEGAKESNEELMKELKGTAEFFKKYIIDKFQRLQEQRDVGTNTDGANLDSESEINCNQVNCEDDDGTDEEIVTKTKLMQKEKEIRDQIADRYSLEKKTLEMQFAKRISEIENEHTNTLAQLKTLLEKKAGEVETLKDFIIKERAQVTAIINSKENEISALIKEHNTLHEEYQKLREKYDNLKKKMDKYDKKALSDHSKSLEMERDKLTNKIADLESQYEMLKQKYKTAKKTAFMYKDYATKKDEHVNSELLRIQNQYKDVFTQLERQLKYYVNSRIQQTSKPNEVFHTQEYTDVLNQLHSDLTTLAKSRYEDWNGT